jgi:hypothetical protein
MEGLNPNAPPPKNTEVKLAKWEYSDPVGVPHPDTIDIVVNVVNSAGQPLSNVNVQVNGEWKIGSLKDESAARWSEASSMKTFEGVSLPSKGSQTLRVPVDLKSLMDSHWKHGRWPYGLRATVIVKAPGLPESRSASAELPITPGD